MLKGDSPAAESLGRIANDYRSIDELLILAEIPERDSAPPGVARTHLLAFAAKLEDAITSSPEVAPLCRYVRHQPDESAGRFIRRVVVPNGLYYLSDEEFRQILRRLEPDEIAKQFTRNQTLISAPGPAVSGATKAILKDPLRLHEFLTNHLQSAGLSSGTGSPQAAASDGEFSVDGRSLLIRIGGTQPVNNLDFSKSFTKTIQGAIAQIQPQGVQCHISGGYAIAAHAATSIRSDSINNIVGTIPLIPILCYVLYRRLIAPLLITLAAGAGLLAAFGLHALFVPAITPLSAVIAATLAGLGIDYGIHTISHYQSAREEGCSSFESSSRTARAVGTSLLAACFTTIFGFLSVLGAKIQMLRDFAILGSLGLVLSLLAILTILPALLRLIDRKPRLPSPNSRFRDALSLMWIASVASRYPRRCISVCAVAACAAGATIALAPSHFPEFESDLSVMHPQPNPPLDAARLIDNRIDEFSESLLVEISAQSPEALTSASYDVASALRAAPPDTQFADTLGLSTLLPDPRLVPARTQAIAAIPVETILSNFDAAVARTIFDPAAFHSYRKFLQSLLRPGPAPTITDLLKEPELASKILPVTCLSGDTTSSPHAIQLVRLKTRIENRTTRESVVTSLRASLAPYKGATLTGLPVIGHDFEVATRGDLPRYIAISMAFVVIWLLIVFRNFRDLLLAFIPVAFSVLCMLGFMIAFDEHFNVASALAVPLLAGIAVDSGVFLVLAAREHRHLGRQELSREYRSTVQAIIGAAVMTILGFGTLYWTSTPAIRSLGLTSVVGVAAGACAALFLLLPLLLLLTPTQSAEQRAA